MTSPSSSSDNSHTKSKSNLDESLKSFKLLDALRSGESSKILPLLNQNTDSPITPLHLAVRCATLQVVQLVLDHSSPSHLTAQDPAGRTPLHTACALGRSDLVSLLLSQPQVDDSIKDYDSKTCLELSKNSEVAKLIQVSRAQLSGSFLALLSAYIASPPTLIVSEAAVDTHPSGHPSDVIPSSTAINTHESAADQLYKFMDRPRSRSIHFNVKEEQTGTTLLHEAARRKDFHMLRLAICRGADVLARDRKNKMPIDVAKDEKVKSILRQTATSEGRALLAHAQGKVVETSSSGIMAPHSVSASLIAPPAIQPTLRGYLSKWTNMARGYNTRWLVLHNGYLSYYRDQKDEGKAVRGSIAMSVAVVTGPDVTKDKLRFEVSSKLGSSYPRFYLKGAHPVEVMRWVDALKQAVDVARVSNPITAKASGSVLKRQSSSPSLDIEKRSFVSRRLSRHIGRSATHAELHSAAGTSGPETGGSPQGSVFAGSLTDDDSYGILGTSTDGKPPYDKEFEMLEQSVKAHIEMTEQLIDSLTIATSPKASPSLDQVRRASTAATGTGTEVLAVSPQRQAKVKQTLKRSIRDLNQMLEDYFSKVAKREMFYVRRYEQELAAKKLWEDNMQMIVRSQAEMEQELQNVARDSSRRKKMLRSLRAEMSGGSVAGLGGDEHAGVAATPSKVAPPALRTVSADAATPSEGTVPPPTMLPTLPTPNPVDEDLDDSEDEFFEAIETGAISVERLAVTKAPLGSSRYSEFEISSLMEGYQDKRTTLPIKADDRPSVSLWGILKNSIGKDLTKISFPVSFNEPISMLQRMAEDMQFSECLDAAAEHQDSLVRLGYVAGFAMSNYASTVGRIAKPFNPLLGETFEYVEPDKQYRYVSEQISHHPPMSACYAESIRWKYYGETDAKNRFTGKSFEIKPTGVAHATLKLPKGFPGVEAYPTASDGSDRVEEHYSWKKVTTVVSNFILGSPVIDHYGDMEIANHRTGERCVLTFKPRGWRGKDANEIKGSVFDSNGKPAWEIAGKWTTQLIARRAGAATGELAPDASVQGREYLLLWKNADQPDNMPFNLTPFAVTLNAVNEALKVWLPPTDCRLRPDQHAFERGAWEKANELKTALEDHQRLTKRRREMGELPPHEPRWFKPCEDDDTGERTWEPVRLGDGGVAYWEERMLVGKARKAGEQVEWTNVDHIFGEFELIEG